MGPIMLDLTGYEVTPDEKEILDHPLIGGIILFSRNYHDHQQLSELITQIKDATRNDIIIAVDHEGGRVQRFREGFSAIPAMGDIFQKCNGDFDKASEYAKQFGWLMAAEVLAFGIDISFAPVLDINGNSEVIGDRSFSDNPEIIIQMASRFIEGMHDAGMKSTGKHFPGHGNVQEDSHIAIPVDKRGKEEILNYDMRVFQAINDRGLLDAVMPAHVIYPEVDKLPAGFSREWIRGILRKNMNFDGVVFSDDLSMEGATVIGDFADRSKAALDAGCDMVLVCNHREGAVKVIDSLPSTYLASERLPKMKMDSGATQGIAELQKSYLWKESQNQLDAFNAL